MGNISEILPDSRWKWCQVKESFPRDALGWLSSIPLAMSPRKKTSYQGSSGSFLKLISPQLGHFSPKSVSEMGRRGQQLRLWVGAPWDGRWAVPPATGTALPGHTGAEAGPPLGSHLRFSFCSSTGKKCSATEGSLFSLSAWPFWWIMKSSRCLLSMLQMPGHRQNFVLFLLYFCCEGIVFQRFAVNCTLNFVQDGDWVLLPVWKCLCNALAKHVLGILL